jgi:hypothetical protein
MAEGNRDYGLYDRAIRALTGARDWWSEQSDPNRPRKRNATDVNLPVETPPKPWYERIPTLESVGEQVGKAAVPSVKQTVKQAGGKVAGVLGASEESAGRAFGTLMDVTDPRNTGSEKKPMSDVAWEAAKGLKSGYEKPFGTTTNVGEEFFKRAPAESLGITPVGEQVLRFGANAVADPTNLIPGHIQAAGLGAALGAGPEAAHMMSWLPPNLFKKARNIEGFTTQLGSGSHAEKILKEGFGIPDSSDILGRWGHGSSYSPATAKAAKKAGKAPVGTSNRSYTGSSYAKYMPIDFGPEVKVLDTVDVPVPREDIDVILKTLHPVKDKNKIEAIEAAWQDQAKYVMEHSDVRSGKIPVEKLAQHYKQIKQDPVALDSVRRLNRLLGEGGTTYGADFGTGASGSYAKGQSPLNQPSQTVEFGAIHYPDYNTSGNYPSIAFDPRQTRFAPIGSNVDPAKTPWQQGKLAPPNTPNPKGGYYSGLMPPDVPGGVSKPVPGQPITLPDVPVPQTPQQIQEAKWAAENANPPKIKPKKPKVYPAEGPTYEGQPISTYEQGTLKELAAVGRPLDKIQTKKLAAIQQYESGRVPEVTPPVPTSVATPINTSLPVYQQIADFQTAMYHAEGNYPSQEAAQIIKQTFDSMSPAGQESWLKHNKQAAENWNLGSIPEAPGLTPEQWDQVAKLESQGHSEDEAIDFVKGGHVPSDYFNSIPTVSEFEPQDALHQPQTQATMEQHWKDIQSIYETHNVPPAWGNDLEEFFGTLSNNPDLSPAEVHQNMIIAAENAGYPGAADEIRELWELKKNPALPEGITGFSDQEVGLGNKLGDVHPMDALTQSEGHALQSFINDFENPESFDADIMEMWGDLPAHMKQAFKESRPDLFDDLQQMNMPGYPMGGGPGKIQAGKATIPKTLTAKTSMDVDHFLDRMVNADETSEVYDAWKALSPQDQIYVKNAHPYEYKTALDIQDTIEHENSWLAGEQGDVEDWSDEIGKLPPVEPPPALGPMGKESIGVLDAEGSLDYLKNTYPEVAENFGKHSGTEMGSIESHTKDVLKQWKTQLTPQEFQDISQRSGIDVEALMNVALPLHDIGKPQAIAAGDKTMQHSHTVPIMRDILQKEGFDPEDIELATELFNHDMIGGLLQGSSKYTPQQVADELVKKAEKVGLDPSDFAKLQLAFFQADASSYPFVTQYMKQQPNGGWISGSPKVKPIEDLIQGPTNIKSAAPAVDNTYKIKVPDAEDMLGGTKSKSIYSKGGQDYLFKEANPPYFADQEVSANKIANLSGLHPIKIEKMEMGGKPGTMQAAVGNNMNWPTLKEVDLTTLTAGELRDIIRNHPVDWLTGNMDAHGAQFLRTPNGIVEIDRGRAFKSYQGNKLHEDYNPQGGPGFYDQVYNDMIKLYKKGKLPQLTEGDISSALEQTIFKMNQNQIPIMQEIHAGLDRSKQGHLDTLANTRMANLRKDMMKFWLNK